MATIVTATKVFFPATQPFFKDVGKRVNDLLTKEFPSDKKEQKVEWKSVTYDGLKLDFSIKTEEGREGPKTSGTIRNEYFHRQVGANFVAELNTDREFKGEVSVADKFVKGAKGIFTVQSQRKDALDYFGTVALEYKHEYASATATAEYGRFTDNALKGSLVVGTQGVSIGANAEYLRRETGVDLKEFKCAVTYASDEFDIVGYGKVNQTKSKQSNTELGASYYHKLNSDLAVGTEVKFDVTNPDKKPALAFGTAYRLQADSVLKARYDTEGKLGLSLAQQVNKTVKLLVSATVDTNSPSGKNGTNVGFNISLTP